MTGIEAMIGAFVVTPGNYTVAVEDLVVKLDSRPGNQAVLTVSANSLRGRPVTEREAVDIAIDVHRQLSAAGTGVDPEMMSYRGADRSRCFVLTFERGTPAA